MKNYYVFAVMALLFIGISCNKDDDGGVVEVNVPPSEVSSSTVVAEIFEGTLV